VTTAAVGRIVVVSERDRCDQTIAGDKCDPHATTPRTGRSRLQAPMPQASIFAPRTAGPPRVRSYDKRGALHRRRDTIATNNGDGRLLFAIGLVLPARNEHMRAGFQMSLLPATRFTTSASLGTTIEHQTLLSVQAPL
jgi:hypothetical protein